MVRRRGRGEGSVFKRADGRWCAVVSAGYGATGRKRKYIYGHTRQEVAEKMNAALVKVQGGEDIASDGRITVGQWLQRWLDLPSKRKPQTIDRYRYAISAHLNPVLGHVKLNRLTVEHIDAFKSQKQREGLTAATVQVSLFCLSAAIQDAQARKLTPRGVNIVRLSGWLPRTKSKHKPLEPDHARAFLEACDGHPYGPISAFMLCTGTRIAEAIGLRLSDVNFEKGFVSISQQVVIINGRGTNIEGSTKSRSSVRNVPLVPPAIKALEQQAAIRDSQSQGRYRAKWKDHGYVFTSAVGTPVTRKRVREGYAEILTAAGLEHRRVHDLRHSFGSLLLSQGVSLKVISELLGHSSITVTADIYLGVMPEVQRDAAERLGSLFV